MPNTPKKQSTEERQMAAIEKDVAALEQKFVPATYRSVKLDLSLLSKSITIISDKEKKAAVSTRVKQCEERVGVMEQKYVPSASKAALGNAPKKDGLTLLTDANKQLAETETVGTEIMTNLVKQRETLFHANQNLKTIQKKTESGDGLLTQMSKWWRD